MTHLRLAVFLLAGACATAGNFQTAHTVGPGGWELGADGSALVIVDVSGDVPYLVLPRVSGRVGVSERTELGGSVGLDGIKFGPRVQLTDPSDEGVVVTAGVSGKVLPLPSPDTLGVLVGAEESLYVGLPTSPESQLVLMGRAAQDVGVVDSNQATLLWAGGAVGWSWSPDGRFRLMPEVGAMVPLLVVDGDDNTGLDGGIVQLGLGVAYGKRN
jgi:hypothetical protein